MKGSEALVWTALKSTGRLFSEAFPAMGPEAARVYGRWSRAWLLVLRGEDTPAVRAALAREATLLKRYVELLPEADRYEAAMALHVRTPRSIPVDAELIALAKTTSIFLDPAREALVAGVAATFHTEINALAKRAASGASLTTFESKLLPHLNALKEMTLTEYDAVITELARESIYQLKPVGTGELRRLASKINALQGAVGQVSFFRSKQFRTFLAQRLSTFRDQVRGAMGPGWTVAAVTEGRIYIARKNLKTGFSVAEYVDGAVVAHELGVSGRLGRAFLPLSAQVKAELDVSALSQNLKDAIRQTPDWGQYDAILMIPSGKEYKPLQLIPSPNSMPQERMLIAAPGGVWPEDLTVPGAVAKTVKVDGPMTRDGCRRVAIYLLAKAQAKLK